MTALRVSTDCAAAPHVSLERHRKTHTHTRMKTVREYLRHAEDCDAQAQKAMSPEQRQMIIDMSNTWRMLADQRRGRIHKAQREALGFDPLPPAMGAAKGDTDTPESGSDR